MIIEIVQDEKINYKDTLRIALLNEEDEVANTQLEGKQFQIGTQLNLKDERWDFVLADGP